MNRLLLATACVLVLTCSLFGDAITLRGTTIAMPASVQRIETGRVFYTDRSGRSHFRSLEDVEHISFDGLPQLDEAAAAMQDDRYSDAVPLLMQALVHAETDVQRIWVHALLARAHDIVGQYVQACGHFAAVVLLEDHAYWRTIAPVSDVNQPEFAAAQEAMTLLRHARRQVTQPQLVSALSQMLQRVEPIHRTLAAEYEGPQIEPGSTVSGILRSAILESKPKAESLGATTHLQEPQDSAPPETPTVALDGFIGQLLEAERWEEALVEFERVARQPGRRDVAELLYQHGRALVGVGRPRDAAVSFTRCAILHRGSPFAVLSLIETAVIYRDTFNRSDTARRLLDLAANAESSHQRSDVLTRIDAVRRSLD